MHVLCQSRVHALCMEAQFPGLCVATESCCSRTFIDLGSLDSMAIRCSRTFRNTMDLWPVVPMVSIVIGVKLWLAGSPQCFSVSLTSAFSATFPVSWVAWVQYEVAKVAGDVTSKTSKQPAWQGANVTPSSLFLFDLSRPRAWREHRLLSGLLSWSNWVTCVPLQHQVAEVC